MSKSVLPLFSSKSCIDFGLTFRSLMHFEFIFAYGIRKCSNFVFLCVLTVVQHSQHDFWKRLSFLHRPVFLFLGQDHALLFIHFF